MSRRPASIVLSVVFAVLALLAWGQVVTVVLHGSDEPRTLNVLHLGIGVAAAVMMFALLCAAYFRADTRRRAERASP